MDGYTAEIEANLSRRQIAKQISDLGTPVSKNIVKRLLWNEGYRRRKPQKKRTMGQHADRNAQFENIAKLKQQYFDAGQPVISMDTKKKEMLGKACSWTDCLPRVSVWKPTMMCGLWLSF